MVNNEYLEKYVDICNKKIRVNNRVLSILRKLGIFERYIFDNLKIGYTDGHILQIIGDNLEQKNFFTDIGILKECKEEFANSITIPIYDENKVLVNIAFYNPYPQSINKLQTLNDEGIFNSSFLKNNSEVILTTSPIEALILIQKKFSKYALHDR